MILFESLLFSPWHLKMHVNKMLTPIIIHPMTLSVFISFFFNSNLELTTAKPTFDMILFPSLSTTKMALTVYSEGSFKIIFRKRNYYQVKSSDKNQIN